MTKEDPVVNEVRAARRSIAEECGNDMRKIVAHANAAALRVASVQDNAA